MNMMRGLEIIYYRGIIVCMRVKKKIIECVGW